MQSKDHIESYYKRLESAFSEHRYQLGAIEEGPFRFSEIWKARHIITCSKEENKGKTADDIFSMLYEQMIAVATQKANEVIKVESEAADVVARKLDEFFKTYNPEKGKEEGFLIRIVQNAAITASQKAANRPLGATGKRKNSNNAKKEKSENSIFSKEDLEAIEKEHLDIVGTFRINADRNPITDPEQLHNRLTSTASLRFHRYAILQDRFQIPIGKNAGKWELLAMCRATNLAIRHLVFTGQISDGNFDAFTRIRQLNEKESHYLQTRWRAFSGELT